ncbi:MAG: hypothetical protein LBQ13_02090, partial [Endomicrobium sp.]|nr:hypothetical protein [Endomicrobium sp.]
MKKVLMLILIMMMLAGVKEVVWGQEVSVSDFSEFNAAISSGEEQTVIVTDHIELKGTCNVGAGTKTVSGGGFNLDGGAKNDAFRLREGKTLKIIGKLTMENFGYVINCAESSVSFDDSEINISSNIIPSYGTMFFSTKSSLNINNSQMELSNNNMSVQGGVLACLETTVTINASILTFLNNQASTGGAIYCDEVSLNIDDSNLTFLNNQASIGGAIYCEKVSLNIDDSSLTFLNNKTLLDNGTMFFVESNVNFSNSNIIFSSNNVNGNGGAIMLEDTSTLIITGSSLTFENNISGSRGGAITLLDSMLTISESSLTFENNISTSQHGGAIMLDTSTLIITGSSLTFENNIAKEKGGGAIMLERAMLTITGSSLTFENNISSRGGAMYFLRSTTTITGSSLTFKNNISSNLGGAIGSLESTVNIDRVKVAFSSNRSSLPGGAIGFLGSITTITGSSLIFENNISSRYGGAVNCSSGQLIFEDSDVEFIGNKAQNGGALCIQCERIVKLTNVTFRDNIATGNGGGIFIETGELTITTNENKISEFAGNKANRQSNGIYMYGAGTITFNGTGRVNMKDAIMATGCNINIEDSCEFYLSGMEISKVKNLKIGDSSTFNLEANTRMAICGDLTIESNGVFNTGFGMEEAVSILGSYIQSGTWTIGIEKREIDNYLSVYEDVILGTGSTLNIDMNGTGADNELRAYRLINYEKGCIGKFGRVVFSSTSKNPNYELTYSNNSIVLTVKGSTETEKDSEVSAGRERDSKVSAERERDSEVSVGTNFGGIKGLNANQKEVARTLDVLSSKEKGEKLAEIGLINNMSEEGKKAALGELSGYFISNVIKGEGE